MRAGRRVGAGAVRAPDCACAPARTRPDERRAHVSHRFLGGLSSRRRQTKRPPDAASFVPPYLGPNLPGVKLISYFFLFFEQIVIPGHWSNVPVRCRDRSRTYWRRRRLPGGRVIDSMGPEYRSFDIDLKALPLFRDFDWNSLAQQAFIDPVTGFTAPVTPSWQHDGYAGEADRLVKALDRKYDLRAFLLRSTRWRRSDNPKNTTAGRVFLSRRQGQTPRPRPPGGKRGAGGLRDRHAGGPRHRVRARPRRGGKIALLPRTRPFRDMTCRHFPRPSRGRQTGPARPERPGETPRLDPAPPLHPGLRARSPETGCGRKIPATSMPYRPADEHGSLRPCAWC